MYNEEQCGYAITDVINTKSTVRKEFTDMWKSYRSKAIFMSNTSLLKDEWQKLIDYVKSCKDDSLRKHAIMAILRELIMEEPSELGSLFEYVVCNTDKESDKFKNLGVSITTYCNAWLNIIDRIPYGKNVDYYVWYNKYHEYLKENYIPWGGIWMPQTDPNPTLDEYVVELCGGTRDMLNNKLDFKCPAYFIPMVTLLNRMHGIEVYDVLDEFPNGMSRIFFKCYDFNSLAILGRLTCPRYHGDLFSVVVDTLDSEPCNAFQLTMTRKMKDWCDVSDALHDMAIHLQHYTTTQQFIDYFGYKTIEKEKEEE